MAGGHGSALVIYSAGISACEKGEQWQPALALLSEMWEAKLEPNVICTTILVSVRARGALAELRLGRLLALPGRPWTVASAPGAALDGSKTAQDRQFRSVT